MTIRVQQALQHILEDLGVSGYNCIIGVWR